MIHQTNHSMQLRFKDWVSFNVLSLLVQFLKFFGASYESICRISFLNSSATLSQTRGLGHFSIDQKASKQSIYILEMVSGSRFHLFVESLMALGLKKRGHNVVMVIDDNFLPIHEFKTIGNEDYWDVKSERAFVFAARFLSNLQLKYVKLSDMIGESAELQYDSKYDSILEATILKHYKVGVVNEDLPLLEAKKKLIKKSIAISAALGNELVNRSPDSVIMSHGIYSTWGPVFQVLDSNSVPILVHGRGKKRHSQVFNWNATGDSWDVSKEWEKVKDTDLTDKELEVIHQYLDSRISHKDDVFVYNFGGETTKDDTLTNLGLDKDKPVYTLFTNVLWDAASAQREIAFSNPVEWVIETIKWFNSNPDKQLIVKIHPAEIVIGTNMPFHKIIIDNVTPNSNVRIIKPDEKINSWSVYAISDLGIVHTTTAGMEMPLVNKPCLVVSKTHYRGKGFTIDVESKEEYYKVLESFHASQVDVDAMREKAIKYAYLLFVRYQIPFNMFFEEKSTNIKGFRYDSIEDYFMDDDFRLVIDCIENRQPVFIN